MPRTLRLYFLLLLLSACWHEPAQYTSQDLALLPCESTGRFFFPLEFDKDGALMYQDQWDDLENFVRERKARDFFLFVHGWDKTASLAETDYQDFVCRFYARMDAAKMDIKRNSSVFVGLFWPSTVFTNYPDLAIIKPVTYYTIRRRADILAASGFQDVMRLFASEFTPDEIEESSFHLIGHSFGGRTILKGFDSCYRSNEASLVFLAKKINIILLLPAVSRDAFGCLVFGLDYFEPSANRLPIERSPNTPTILNSDNADTTIPAALMEEIEKQIAENAQFEEEMRRAKEGKERNEVRKRFGRFRPMDIVHLVNIYSRNDFANRFLYPIGSLIAPISSDTIACSMGGCGTHYLDSLMVDKRGDIANPDILNSEQIIDLDASSIISSHTDIYKGRVAKLLWQVV